jgi:hypothetical protein
MDRLTADIESVEREWLRAVRARRRLLQLALLEQLVLLGAVVVTLALAVAGKAPPALAAASIPAYVAARAALQRLGGTDTSADAALLHARLADLQADGTVGGALPAPPAASAGVRRSSSTRRASSVAAPPT